MTKIEPTTLEIPTWASIQAKREALVTNSSSSLAASLHTTSHKPFVIQRVNHPRAGPKSVNGLVDFKSLITFLHSDLMLRHFAVGVTWIQKSPHHQQTRVQHTATKWNGLVINFYPSTNTVLFQGSAALAELATQYLLKFISNDSTVNLSDSCAPTHHHDKWNNDDDDSNDGNRKTRWDTANTPRLGPSTTTSKPTRGPLTSTQQRLNGKGNDHKQHDNDDLLYQICDTLTACFTCVFRPTHFYANTNIGEASNPGPPARQKSAPITEFSVQKILDSRLSKRHDAGTVQYLVAWKGKDKNNMNKPYANTWEPEENVVNSLDLLSSFHNAKGNSKKPVGKSILQLLTLATAKPKTKPKGNKQQARRTLSDLLPSNKSVANSTLTRSKSQGSTPAIPSSYIDNDNDIVLNAPNPLSEAPLDEAVDSNEEEEETFDPMNFDLFNTAPIIARFESLPEPDQLHTVLLPPLLKFT